MEENTLYDRIGETDLNPTYKDGQVLQHIDMNNIVGVTKEGINANYHDIQKIENGEKIVGNAVQLNGAALSRYLDETLQANDNKVPSSQQVKNYVDDLFSDFNAPVRGVDYWTDSDESEIIDDTTTAVKEAIEGDYYDKSDIDTKLLDKLETDDIVDNLNSSSSDKVLSAKQGGILKDLISTKLSESDLQMVESSDVENGSQIIDGTGYARLNKIYGDTEQNGTPTPDNPVDIEVVTGDIEVNISNSDNTLSQNFNLSLGDIELCKIGNYQDYIYQNNGKWYIHEEIGKIILNGSEDWTSESAYSGYYRYAISRFLGTLNTNNAMNNRLIQRISQAHGGYEYLYIQANEGTIHIQILQSRLSSSNVSDFKNWLSNNNVKTYYVLLNPIDYEITDKTLLTQLNKIYNLSLYKNESNFYITASDLSPKLDITYAITERDIYPKEEVDDIISKKLSAITDSSIINEIEIEELYDEDTNTHYYISHIPNKDSKGNLIRLQHGFAQNEDTVQATTNDTAREFACRNNATFCVNASIFGIDDTEENYHHAMGTIIKDGQLISNYDNDGYTEQTKNKMRILGVKSDNSLEEYPFESTYQDLINEGCINTFSGYGCCMKNGIILTENDEQDIWNLIAQNTTTKDLYFICCNGRNIDNEEGMSQIKLCEILRDNYNCDFAFRLDGGGSACFVKNGVMMNTPYDDYGTTIRKVPDYIYFSKEPTNNIDINTNMILKFISDTEEKLNETFNRLYYLQNIYNNRLNFNFPNIRNTTESGMRLRYTKDGTLKSSLIFDTNDQPLVFSVYDNINNRTVAKIDGPNEEIVVNSKIIGAFFRTGYNVTNANDAVNSGIYRLPGNASNSPYPSGVGAMLLVLKGESGGVRQIAMAQTTDSTTRAWYTRNSNSDITSWETWKVILTPTSSIS